MRTRSWATALVFLITVAAVMLGGSSVGARVAPAITLSPTLAAAGNSVKFNGDSGVEEAGGCEVRLDGKSLDAACSVDKGGVVHGSFQVPAWHAPGSAEVEVCHPGCGGGIELVTPWSWTGGLEIGVTVPDVVGATAAVAEESLKRDGLEGAPDPEPTDDRQTVQAQDPKAGAVVPIGSSVVLYLSPAEPELVQVPDLVGQAGGDAAETLKGAGFVPVACDTKGTVFRQDPGAGAWKPPGTEVRLWCQEPAPTSPKPAGDELPTPTEPTTTDPTTTEEPPTSSESTTAGPTDITSATETTTSPSPSSTQTSPTTVVDDGTVLLFATGVDWRVIGLAAALIIGVTAGSFLSGRRARVRRVGPRWSPDHLGVDGRTGTTTTGVRESDSHSIHVVGITGDRVHTLEER